MNCGISFSLVKDVLSKHMIENLFPYHAAETNSSFCSTFLTLEYSPYEYYYTGENNISTQKEAKTKRKNKNNQINTSTN